MNNLMSAPLNDQEQFSLHSGLVTRLWGAGIDWQRVDFDAATAMPLTQKSRWTGEPWSSI